jgi:hypothetical protein
MKALIVAALVAASVCVFASTAGAARPIVPSQARAIHDTKVEILHHYINLLDTSRPSGAELMPMAQVACDPLTDTLYRCTWMGKSPIFYTVFGRAKVRFFKYATDVSLYDVKCYNAPKNPMDTCSYAT